MLGYPWLASGFPALPEREERRAKWLTAVATLVLLVILALVITRPWSAERPQLIDPGDSAPALDSGLSPDVSADIEIGGERLDV